MKKTMNFLSAAATIVLASAFAACSSDALINEEAPVKEQEKVSLTVTATQGTRTPDTRLVYTPSGDGKTMKVEWSANETLGVVTSDGSNLGDKEFLTSTNEEAAASATFTGSASASTDNKYNFYYYPPVAVGAATISDNTLTMNVVEQGYYFDNSLLPYYNLMYTKQAVDPSTETVELYHAFALIRLVLTLPATAGDISTIALSTWESVFPTTAKLTYDTEGGVALTYEGSTDALAIVFPVVDGSGVPNGDGSRTITAYMMVPEVKDFTGQLCKVTVTDEDGNTFSYVYNLTDNTDNTAATGNITPQKLYTFTATLKEDRWATSNIYWDGEAGKLTFDTNINIIGKTATQGLYFKWGSWMGISPVDDWEDNVTKVYPTGSLPDEYTFDDVPFVSGNADLSADNDICAHIDENWRMPSKEEFEALIDAAEGVNFLNEVEGTTPSDEGTASNYVGILFDNLVYLPYAGSINYIYLRANVLTYWTKTDASSDPEAHFPNMSYAIETDLSDVSLLAFKFSPIERANSLPIRCIKKAAGE